MSTIDRRGATVSAADPPIGTNPNPDLAIKAPVRVATTGSNITLSALQTIDGIALSVGDRVLVKDQTDATTNGLYNVQTSAWTRTIDANNNSQFATGMLVTVTAGAANANVTFQLTTASPITLATSALVFVATLRGVTAILGVADLRFFGATPGVNCQPAVVLAIAAGYKHVFLPAGYFYQGGGTGPQVGATEIPANLEIIGENPQTSLIKAVDRTNSGIPGFIYLNSFSVLTNCGTQSYPGDTQTSPSGTHQKTVSQPRVTNPGDAKATYVPWTGSTVINLGANITSPEGVVSTDNPGIQIVQNSVGDGFYAQTTAAGAGCRLQTAGNGDSGLEIDNALLNPSNPHIGLIVTERGTNSGGAAAILERKTGSTSPLLLLQDDNTGVSPNPAFAVSLRINDSIFPNSGQYLFAGATKGIRIWTSGSGTLLEGVDGATGISSYQPFTIGGSALTFQTLGTTALSVFASGGVGIGPSPSDPGGSGFTATNITTTNVAISALLGVGGGVLASSLCAIAAGTTTKSQINLASSTAPTSPNNGDIWFDGASLKIRIGGVTKTFTVT
jgi:hypothetical protein